MTRREAAARRLVLAVLERMPAGRLELLEPDRSVHTLGPGGEPAARVEVRDPAAWPALLRGSRGLAAGYVDGLWGTSDPTAVIRVAARNAPALDAVRRRSAIARRPYQRLRGLASRGSRLQVREDIRRHYDLGDDLFALMLDETMSYSAAYFREPGAELADAAVAKLELVCSKLGLGPDDHVVEIGTGWGGFAVHAAMTRGCRVTTTTISEAQRAHATERVARAGLADRVTVLGCDYRDLRGSYSALVSLEMIEAVGHRRFGTYFRACSDLLVPDGRMLLQAITTDDRAFDLEKGARTFVNTTIFPNGCLPSQRVIAEGIARRTDLRMVHHEDMTAHYALTLRAWRENVETHAEDLRDLGYDERFQRLWRFYLSYCEAGFLEQRIAVGQTLLAKPRWAGDVPATAEIAPVGRAPVARLTDRRRGRAYRRHATTPEERR
jgi:cyclopropane-fatty-acyl-phospholipid synthase